VLLLHSDAILQNVRIALELDDDLPPLRGDKVQLQQVMLNLMLNAFEAMKDCAVAEREVKLRVARENAGSIQVAVSDRGTGFSRDKTRQNLQPFYTTKREGLGMGTVDLSIHHPSSRRDGLWRRITATTARRFTSQCQLPKKPRKRHPRSNRESLPASLD
jgi:C4-dicarboxylate-specific signal transduction histidine kinase